MSHMENDWLHRMKSVQEKALAKGLQSIIEVGSAKGQGYASVAHILQFGIIERGRYYHKFSSESELETDLGSLNYVATLHGLRLFGVYQSESQWMGLATSKKYLVDVLVVWNRHATPPGELIAYAEEDADKRDLPRVEDLPADDDTKKPDGRARATAPPPPWNNDTHCL